MKRIFSAVWRNARRYAGLIGLTTVAAVLLGAATVVPAQAHGTVTSGEIANQTIRSVDISRGGVASSEIRNQSIKSWDIDRGSVAQSEIRNQSIRSVDISAGGVGTSEIRDDTILEADLSPGVRDQLGQGPKGDKGDPGQDGQDGQDGVSGYTVFQSVQDFGPGGIGGSWCGAPNANTENEGWAVVGGGAQLTAEDVNNGVNVVSSWPNLDDPNNPGWSVQLNKPPNYDPGEVTLYAVCVKVTDAPTN